MMSQAEAPEEAVPDARRPTASTRAQDAGADLEKALKKTHAAPRASETLRQEGLEAPQQDEAEGALLGVTTPQASPASPALEKEAVRQQTAAVGFAAEPPALAEKDASDLAASAQAPAAVRPDSAEGRMKAAGPRRREQVDRAAATVLQVGEGRAAPASADVCAALTSRQPRTADEARVLREAWRACAQTEPEGPRADEAHVRVVELGALAYRMSHDAGDLAKLRADAVAYLERADARQKPRVERVLEEFAEVAPER
jgi:hypothetical protein